MSSRLALLSATLLCFGTLSVSTLASAAEDALALCKTQARQVLDAGKDAKPDYKSAISQCEKASEGLKGKPAQNEVRVLIASMVDQRDDGVVDRKMAFKLFSIAAEKGDMVSMNRLGELYRDGRGIDADDVKAVEWFTKAANLGSGPAMSNLGDAYTDGKGVDANDETAFEWYRKGAALNNVNSIQSLAFAYDTGKGVSKDLVKAIDNYQMAATLGNSNAMNNIGVLYENGEVVTQDYAAARGWYERAIAADNNSMALYNLSVLFKEGRGVYADPVKAGQLIARSLAGNEEYARNELQTNPGHWNEQSWQEIQKAFAAERGYKGPIDGKPNPELMGLIAKPVE